MQLVSHITLPGFAFQQYNPKMELTGCVTVAGLFNIGADGLCRPAVEQPPIRFADECAGPEEPPQELLRQADFLPFKPGTDVTVLAHAVSPSGRPETSWLCGLRGGGLEAVLRIHGPRDWARSDAGRVVPGPARPVSDVALSWRLAWGGAEIDASGQPTGEVDAQNPLGAGYARAGAEPALIGHPAPQIEAADAPITAADQHGPVPAGLAPVGPVSVWRADFSGTYDKQWAQTRHPFLPVNFDSRFYHCAPPWQRSPSFLRGDEVFDLLNLHPAARYLRLMLPRLAFGAVASFRSGASLRQPLALDGVHFELLGPMPQLRLTWRTSFLWLSGITQIDVGELVFDSLHTPLPEPAYAG